MARMLMFHEKKQLYQIIAAVICFIAFMVMIMFCTWMVTSSNEKKVIYCQPEDPREVCHGR